MAGEANIWNPRTLVEISADTKSVEEKLTAIATQTLFTLTEFIYVVGTGALEVHKNGLLLTKGTDWVEQTGTTFSLTSPATAGDIVVASGHVGITGAVDVRDTDIYVSNYQAIRDYAGTEILLLSQGRATISDGGEDFFQKNTGAAPGFYVDNNDTVIVPTGGDGSVGWLKKVANIIPTATTTSMVALKGLIAGQTIVKTAEFSTGNGGAGTYDVIAGTGTANTYNIIAHATLSLSFVLREVNPFDVRAIGINTAVLDNKAAWQHLLTSMTSVSHVRYTGVGSYTFLSNSACTRDLGIQCDEGVIIDCLSGSYTGGNWTKFSGTLVQIEDLGSNATLGDRALTFTGAPTVVKQDVLIIYNPTSSSWSGFRATYNAGEFCKVVSISGSTIEITGALYDSYITTAVDVYKLVPIKVTIDNIDIRGNIVASLLDFELCTDCVVTNLKSQHKNNSVIFMDRCYNMRIEPTVIFNEGDGGDDYGVSVSNSQVVRVVGGDIYSRRHAVTTGGGASTGHVSCRDIKVIGSTLSNSDASGVHCADFHGNTEDSAYIDCTIYGGCTWQGKNNGYTNCKITDLSVGVVNLAAEVLGGLHYMDNCDLTTNVDPSGTSRGIVDVGGNSSPVTANTTEDCIFRLHNCTVNGTNMGAGTALLTFVNNGCVNNTNFDIDSINLEVNDIGQILRTTNTTGTPAADYIVVDNIKSNGLTGKLLATHVGSAYSAFPHKLQRQTGRETLATPAGDDVFGVLTAYTWVYPRVPHCSTSVSGAGTASLGRSNSIIGVATAFRCREADIQVGYQVSDTAESFTTGVNVDVNWTVSIDEL